MLLVSLDRQELSIDREAVDSEARELVLDAYRSAKISVSDRQSKSNAALSVTARRTRIFRGRSRDTGRTYHRDGRPLTARPLAGDGNLDGKAMRLGRRGDRNWTGQRPDGYGFRTGMRRRGNRRFAVGWKGIMVALGPVPC
jgi:hypothetical protein